MDSHLELLLSLSTPISIAVTRDIWPGSTPNCPVVLGSITSSASPSKTFLLGDKTFINEDDAGSVIMKARQHWFAEDKID